MQVAVGVPIPHVRECSTCMNCWYSPLRDPPGALPPGFAMRFRDTTPLRVVPSSEEIHLRRRTLPNCMECWGCTTRLHPLQPLHAYNISFQPEQGKSLQWLFLAGVCMAEGGAVSCRCVCVISMAQSNHQRHVHCLACVPTFLADDYSCCTTQVPDKHLSDELLCAQVPQ
jgi:hypothetical protein